MTDRSPSLITLEHTREELVRVQWTQWRSFLKAHLQLLDARAATDQPASPFEHDPHSAASREDAARAQLANLDPQRRALFEQVYEQARQKAQADAEQARAALPSDARGKPLDPDTIDKEVLQAYWPTLKAAARGRRAAGCQSSPDRGGWSRHRRFWRPLSSMPTRLPARVGAAQRPERSSAVLRCSL